MKTESIIGLVMLGLCILYLMQNFRITKQYKDFNEICKLQDKISKNINDRVELIFNYATNRGLPIKIINKSGFPLPKYETDGAAGFDIRAVFEPFCVKEVLETLTEEEKELATTITIPPGGQYNFNTGLYVQIPEGYELQIRGRSGNAMRYGISITHGVGTIDSDYRGEIKIFITNHGTKPFRVKNGDRIAQGIIAPVLRAEWIEVEELSDTDRGQAGFGSTGV